MHERDADSFIAKFTYDDPADEVSHCAGIGGLHKWIHDVLPVLQVEHLDEHEDASQCGVQTGKGTTLKMKLGMSTACAIVSRLMLVRDTT